MLSPPSGTARPCPPEKQTATARGMVHRGVSREKFGKFERNGKETRDSGVYKPSVCREKFGKFERPGKKRGRLMQSRSLGHAGRCVGHVVGSLI